MTTLAALDALSRAEVTAYLAADGAVRLDAAFPPLPDVLALAREHRDGIAALLRQEVNEADFPRSNLPRSPARTAEEKPRAASTKRPMSWEDPAELPQPGDGAAAAAAGGGGASASNRPAGGAVLVTRWGRA